MSKCRHGLACPLTPIALAEKNFASATPKSGTCTILARSTFPSRAPFTDELLARGLAEQHRWAPNTGWVTFRVRGETDIEHAVWLMRLSYLRFALKAAADPNRLLEEESKSLHLDPRLKELLGRFVPSRQQLPHA
jgi:luciferase-like monooxygenase